MELPLKSDMEKQEFFQNLGSKLKSYNENLVASQLSGLLLSRLVLSNVTAQKYLLPYLLSPQTSKYHFFCIIQFCKSKSFLK